MSTSGSSSTAAGTTGRSAAVVGRHRWPTLGEVYVAKPQAPSDRKFGLSVGLVLIVIAAFSLWHGRVGRAEVTAACGLALVLAALIRPSSLRGIATGWGKIGHALGYVNSRVLLTLLFAVVIWPVGVVSRLFGSDALSVRRRGVSFWAPYSSRLRDPKHYERLF
jgi:hypothetical protein